MQPKDLMRQGGPQKTGAHATTPKTGLGKADLSSATPPPKTLVPKQDVPAIDSPNANDNTESIKPKTKKTGLSPAQRLLKNTERKEKRKKKPADQNRTQTPKEHHSISTAKKRAKKLENLAENIDELESEIKKSIKDFKKQKSEAKRDIAMLKTDIQLVQGKIEYNIAGINIALEEFNTAIRESGILNIIEQADQEPALQRIMNHKGFDFADEIINFGAPAETPAISMDDAFKQAADKLKSKIRSLRAPYENCNKSESVRKALEPTNKKTLEAIFRANTSAQDLRYMAEILERLPAIFIAKANVQDVMPELETLYETLLEIEETRHLLIGQIKTLNAETNSLENYFNMICDQSEERIETANQLVQSYKEIRTARLGETVAEMTGQDPASYEQLLWFDHNPDLPHPDDRFIDGGDIGNADMNYRR